MKEINGLRVMERNDLERVCPSFYATQPKEDVSDKYTFLNTREIACQLWDNGWMPVSAREQRANIADNKGFTKHIVRFANKDFKVNGERIEIVGVNSHNRAAAFSLMAGVFRLVCSNGMVAKTSDFGSFKIKHIGDIGSQVQEAVNKISGTASKIAGSIEDFKTIDLTQNERGLFASTAHEYLYGENNHAPITPRGLLITRRRTDEGTDLWTTFNKVQENIMKGGIRGRAKTGRRTRTRAIKDISKDVKLNQALWTMAENFAQLKRDN
jgi:hypothetical protein